MTSCQSVKLLSNRRQIPQGTCKAIIITWRIAAIIGTAQSRLPRNLPPSFISLANWHSVNPPYFIGEISFDNGHFIARFDLAGVGFIRVNMHFQRKAFIYTDFHMIKYGASLVVRLHRNNIAIPNACRHGIGG